MRRQASGAFSTTRPPPNVSRPRSQHFDSSPGRQEVVRWRDLQLPLYRALAQFRWPGEPLPPVVGYFLLPERIEESGIDELALDEALFASAKAGGRERGRTDQSAESFGLLARSSSTTLPVSFLAKIQRK